MKIVASFKVSPETQDIQTRPDRSLNLERAQWKVGTYDLNAIEAARQLADEVGGTVVGLSAGGSALENAKLTKDALSRGLDELVTVVDENLVGSESYQTASVLAESLTEIGDVDLVLVGAGSSDEYTQQVGNHLGQILGWPTLNAIETIEAEGDHLKVERVLEDGVQVIEVQLPAVLSLTSGANTPRIAGMKDILAAGKKPVTSVAAGVLPSPTATPVSQLAPEQVDRRQIILEGVDAAAELAIHLKAL
ncbi:MAG: hypothetical protein LBG99_06765 [Propionibacteriaceae bacterium]|nr:hypothetical protein [Propionibacteriaceae bacterium]